MQSTSYTIPSQTTPGIYYRVTVFADGASACDCPDATYRRRQCKHQRQVIAGAIPPQPVRPARTEADLTPLPLTPHAGRCYCVQCTILRAAADRDAGYLAFLRDAHRRDAALVDLIDRAVAAAAGVSS
jgi:hypothetical protein